MSDYKPSALNVTLLAPGEVFGGAERQILTLMEYLHGRLTCLKLVVFHDAELANRGRAMGLDVEVLGVRGLIDRCALDRLIHIVTSCRIHVVHVHGYRATAYAAFARRRSSFETVKTEHGAVEAYSSFAFDRLRPRIYRAIENWAARRLRADLVYVTSDLQQRCIGEHQGMARHVIHNGISKLPVPTAIAPPELLPKHHHLVVVGRLEAVKGFDTAIRAMTSSRVPTNVLLHIIGTGPQQQELERLIAALNLNDRVRLLGFRANIYDYLAHADALLIPSLHEGLPYTMLEAMMLGTPIIASRVGGLAEVLADRQTAILVAPQNHEQLAEAIHALLDSPSLAVQLRNAGKDVVTTKFSGHIMGEAYLRLFKAAACRL